MQGAFVGKDAELSQLDAVLARADGGSGSIVLISGEAGIGKTRLCAELRQTQRRRGGLVLPGRAVPEEMSLPYSALADALRAARRTAPAVWEAARARGEVLWAIAPELAAEAEVRERSVDRAVLFEALLDAVDEAIGEASTLWVLDDIHWAHDSVWEFVRYTTRRIADMGLVLAVTYREEEIGPWHPWWPALVRLKRDPVVHNLPLARLSPADGERLVRAIEPALPVDTVTEILRRAAGTPLLLEELTSLTARPGRQLPVPDTVRATVRERAERLSPRARALLEAAAVLGLDMDAQLLAVVVPEGDPDDLVAAGLLQRDDEGLRFRHPLLHEAAHEAVPAARRRVLHERIADAMAKSERHSAEHVAARLEWARRPEAALSVLESAAREAARAGHVARKATLQLGAFQLAQRHRPLAGRRADLERTAIEDLFVADRWTELDPLLRGVWLRRHEFPHAERAELAAVFCQHLFSTGSIEQALSVATEELAVLERDNAMDVAGPVLREVALVAWFKGDGVTARTAVDRALEIAQHTGDIELEIKARRTEMVRRHVRGRVLPDGGGS